MGCVQELQSVPWIIRLNLLGHRDESVEKKIVFALRNFYRYKQKTALRKFLSVLQRIKHYKQAAETRINFRYPRS